MKETQETIMQWHKETFPKETLDGQKRKFAEECKEFNEANWFHKITELADMYIVACGIRRLEKKTHTHKLLFECVECARETYHIPSFLFRLSVNHKMKINRKRSWKRIGGAYKHKQ